MPVDFEDGIFKAKDFRAWGSSRLRPPSMCTRKTKGFKTNVIHQTSGSEHAPSPQFTGLRQIRGWADTHDGDVLRGSCRASPPDGFALAHRARRLRVRLIRRRE